MGDLLACLDPEAAIQTGPADSSRPAANTFGDDHIF